jgi:hypothetical protein
MSRWCECRLEGDQDRLLDIVRRFPSPIWRSIIAAPRSAPLICLVLPSDIRAEPCTASKMETSFPMFAEGAKPSPPGETGGEIAQYVAIHVRRHDDVELLRRIASWWWQLSIRMCFDLIDG